MQSKTTNQFLADSYFACCGLPGVELILYLSVGHCRKTAVDKIHGPRMKGFQYLVIVYIPIPQLWLTV